MWLCLFGTGRTLAPGWLRSAQATRMFSVQICKQANFTCWTGFSAAAGPNSVMTAAAVEKDDFRLSRLKDGFIQAKLREVRNWSKLQARESLNLPLIL
ncbi:hypothetical protein DUI87_08539 [Hirundo rustica rustica]|uniref:Uncharacterized protein n=1 Tax=Hirundo rustica rustica TaxID=333673 RepID=A0A3M0KK77_HIRRU|nr:hypothetical protein DUI87_08539 [Hirundo rustica rustica]